MTPFTCGIPDPEAMGGVSAHAVKCAADEEKRRQPPKEGEEIGNPERRDNDFLKKTAAISISQSQEKTEKGNQKTAGDSDEDSLQKKAETEPVPVIKSEICFEKLFVKLQAGFFPFRLFRLRVHNLSDRNKPRRCCSLKIKV